MVDNKIVENLDVNGNPIPKVYIKVQDHCEGLGFLILRDKFKIEDIFPEENTDEKYILSEIYLTDEEYAKIPEFTGF